MAATTRAPTKRTPAGKAPSKGVQSILAQLEKKEWVVKPDWDTYLSVEAPFDHVGYFRREVTARYHHNGYDWDIHGSLYTPFREVMPGYAFVLIHGGGVNELDFLVTPDGRPGLAAVIAAQGFRVFTPSYPGLWTPGGKWKVPVTQRKPAYLFDREIGEEELKDRIMKATYQVYMHGIGLLVEKCLPRYRLFVHGHSTGGPMAADLHKYVVTPKVVGILGWGSGGPDGWILQWRKETGAGGGTTRQGLTDLNYRTVDEYRNSAGYEDLPELTPWGRIEQRFELTRDTTPMFNPPVQNLSHSGVEERLAEYHRITGLPRREYFGHLEEPDPEFLKSIKALLLVGENDLNHWKRGGERPDQRQDGFIAKKYTEKTRGAHLVVIPKYTHMAHWALHNEKIAYLWLWAIKSGYFGDLT